MGSPIPPAVLKSSRPLPCVEGNSDLWALGQAAQRMEQRSESTKVRTATQCDPASVAKQVFWKLTEKNLVPILWSSRSQWV